MKVLVCGGAGYIGAHMCRMLASAGHEVFVFDNLTTGHAYAVQWGPLVQGDLLRPDDLERIFSARSYDVVMHFCAKSLVGESMRDPGGYFRNNVTGTVNLLDAMVRHGTRNFIFSSSAAVYGMPHDLPIAEGHPTAPINPYGRTKLLVEQLLPAYDTEFGIRSVALRYFNAAGAAPDGLIGEDHEPETHLIPNVLRSVVDKRSGSLQVFGDDYDTPDGSCVRDYIHVNDIASAHMLAMDHLARGGTSQVMNLGNGAGFSVLQVIDTARRVTGKRIDYQVMPRRPGDPPVLVASSTKAQTILGWRPEFGTLDSIVETAWAWHRNRAARE
ncbi:MAG: hypothetical protein AMS22_09710 [Thiotrichales bacterium SG8_50]|nr:MAG: hypothetical protein AMS22_09710 [Thiotrichales bacterium SG8_50]